jgi:hypothetical protein
VLPPSPHVKRFSQFFFPIPCLFHERHGAQQRTAFCREFDLAGISFAESRVFFATLTVPVAVGLAAFAVFPLAGEITVFVFSVFALTGMSVHHVILSDITVVSRK